MTLAADRLIEDGAVTVAQVARAVGYTDPYAFSAAFKRARGVTPSEFRRTGSGRRADAAPPALSRVRS